MEKEKTKKDSYRILREKLLSKTELRRDLPGWTVAKQNDLVNFDRRQKYHDEKWQDHVNLVADYDLAGVCDGDDGLDVVDICKQLDNMGINDRYKAVLVGMAGGLKNKELAMLLHCSVNTVIKLKRKALDAVSAHYGNRDDVVALIGKAGKR